MLEHPEWVEPQAVKGALGLWEWNPPGGGSSFAQELKTPQPVSTKRLDKAWTQLQAMRERYRSSDIPASMAGTARLEPVKRPAVPAAPCRR